MKYEQTTCNPGRIDRFLEQRLTEQEQSAFEAHLDDCDDCRMQLESTAADADVWSAVSDSLRDVPPPDDSTLDAAAEETSYRHDAVLKLLKPTDDDRMLGRLGTYEVVGVIGSGGMGVVLKALDVALNRYVAIKVLAPHLGGSGSARRRFSREAQAAAAVVHDNVMEIHGVAEAEGLPYLVMPYVPGPSLQRRLDDDGPLGLAEILRIGVQTASGLAAAHAQGLVHRDVKPANILLADGVERVKLTDFGLARAADDASLTRTGIIAGTPQYMSPEQARGESVDQRSDLFSLGSVLYAMCTGREPFRAETSYGILRRITDDEPRPIREINPDIPEWLCRIIERLLSKQPDDRFASAEAVAELLEACLAHVQQPTVVPLPASFVPQSGGHRFFSISHRLRGVIVMMSILGMGLLGMVLMQASEAPDISGKWTGEHWGSVVLESKQPGRYEGSFAGADESTPGTVCLKWSRLERRFNGTWQSGDDRNGKISLRLVDDEIRGARTTSNKANTAPASPRLADLSWTRSIGKKPRRIPGNTTASENQQAGLQVRAAVEVAEDVERDLDAETTEEVVSWDRGDGTILRLFPIGEVLWNESDVVSAKVKPSQDAPSNYSIEINLTKEAGERIGRQTKHLLETTPKVHVATFVDGKIRHAARLHSPVHGKMELTGNFSKQEAEQLLARISSSNRPPTVQEVPGTTDSPAKQTVENPLIGKWRTTAEGSIEVNAGGDIHYQAGDNFQSQTFVFDSSSMTGPGGTGSYQILPNGRFRLAVPSDPENSPYLYHYKQFDSDNIRVLLLRKENPDVPVIPHIGFWLQFTRVKDTRAEPTGRQPATKEVPAEQEIPETTDSPVKQAVENPLIGTWEATAGGTIRLNAVGDVHYYTKDDYSPRTLVFDSSSMTTGGSTFRYHILPDSKFRLFDTSDGEEKVHAFCHYKQIDSDNIRLSLFSGEQSDSAEWMQLTRVKDTRAEPAGRQPATKEVPAAVDSAQRDRPRGSVEESPRTAPSTVENPLIGKWETTAGGVISFNAVGDVHYYAKDDYPPRTLVFDSSSMITGGSTFRYHILPNSKFRLFHTSDGEERIHAFYHYKQIDSDNIRLSLFRDQQGVSDEWFQLTRVKDTRAEPAGRQPATKEVPAQEEAPEAG